MNSQKSIILGIAVSLLVLVDSKAQPSERIWNAGNVEALVFSESGNHAIAFALSGDYSGEESPALFYLDLINLLSFSTTRRDTIEIMSSIKDEVFWQNDSLYSIFSAGLFTINGSEVRLPRLERSIGVVRYDLENGQIMYISGDYPNQNLNLFSHGHISLMRRLNRIMFPAEGLPNLIVDWNRASGSSYVAEYDEDSVSVVIIDEMNQVFTPWKKLHYNPFEPHHIVLTNWCLALLSEAEETLRLEAAFAPDSVIQFTNVKSLATDGEGIYFMNSQGLCMVSENGSVRRIEHISNSEGYQLVKATRDRFILTRGLSQVDSASGGLIVRIIDRN